MNFALSLALCLTFACGGSSFEEGDFLKEEVQNDKRFWRSCSSDADCSPGKCCLKYGFSMCRAYLAEGKPCRLSSTCFWKCQEGLVCAKKPPFGFRKCTRPRTPPPTEEVGSGGMGM
ncbi:uncharacterized protein [Pocillopora verrucosa]|uniref:uncharacterized protein n=1 Tax=Pocillopora verrucosa TaxID=203993 RepID=UPI003341B225